MTKDPKRLEEIALHHAELWLGDYSPLVDRFCELTGMDYDHALAAMMWMQLASIVTQLDR